MNSKLSLFIVDIFSSLPPDTSFYFQILVPKKSKIKDWSHGASSGSHQCCQMNDIFRVLFIVVERQTADNGYVFEWMSFLFN